MSAFSKVKKIKSSARGKTKTKVAVSMNNPQYNSQSAADTSSVPPADASMEVDSAAGASDSTIDGWNPAALHRQNVRSSGSINPRYVFAGTAGTAVADMVDRKADECMDEIKTLLDIKDEAIGDLKAFLGAHGLATFRQIGNVSDDACIRMAWLVPSQVSLDTVRHFTKLRDTFRDLSSNELKLTVNDQVSKVNSQIATVNNQIATVNSQIATVNSQIATVNSQITTVSHKITALDDEIDNSTDIWETFNDAQRKKYGGDRNNWVDKLNNRLNRLDRKEEQLNDEKKRLDRKEEQLNDEKKQLNERLNELIKQQAGSFKHELHEYTRKFDSSENYTHDLNWELDFVQRDEFTQVYEVTIQAINAFEQNPAQDTEFRFAVVDGASGSGKSRLCWEVGQTLVNRKNAQFIFVNCDGMHFELSDITERDSRIIAQCLAHVLLRRFAPEDTVDRYSYNLNQVLSRIKEDTGSTVVVMQLDEYSTNQRLVRALIRACYITFLKGSMNESNVLVVPLLSGIPFANLRNNLIEVSKRATPVFVSLAGMNDVAGLEGSLRKAVEIPLNVDLSLLTSTFGGFPRLFSWCREVLEEPGHKEIRERLCNRDAKEIDKDACTQVFGMVLQKYRAAYPFQLWVRAFAADPSKGEDKRVSHSALQRAIAHVKRLHAFAVAGTVVAAGNVVCRDDQVNDKREVTLSKTFQELSAVGLFTLAFNADGTYGTVYFPLLALSAYADVSLIGNGETIVASSYSWETLEQIAMDSLRCHWNAIWYLKGKCQVSVNELRPGALHNSTPLLKVQIDKEIGPCQLLASEWCGNMSTKFPSGSDGKGAEVGITDGNAYLMVPNQAGIDGVAVMGSVVWYNQTKSRLLVTASGKESKTALRQGEVEKLRGTMENAANKFSFAKGDGVLDNIATMYDIFTNRIAGPKLDPTKLADNVLVTTNDNFAEVVGPVYSGCSRLFSV